MLEALFIWSALIFVFQYIVPVVILVVLVLFLLAVVYDIIHLLEEGY